TGLDRHFKMEFDWRFVEVKPVGTIPTLPDEMRRRLRRDLLDPDLLREVLPPERFVFQGFTIFRGIEVTDQEVLSSLERDLLDKDLAEMPDRKPADEDLLQFGLRNIIVAPLLYQGRVIGTLELGSPLPGDLDATHLPKLLQILPLFSMAVQRSMEELNARIQAFIKE